MTYRNIYQLVKDGKLIFAKGEAREELASEALESMDDSSDTNTINESSDNKEEKIEKIQTLDIVNAVMQKYNNYLNNTKISWDFYIKNGRITSADNFSYVDDLYNLLNKTLDEKQLIWVATYNKLFDKMTDISFCKNLSIYGREKYGSPFIAEGMALLLYELSVDWAVFLARYFKELPELKDNEDSFFKKFPNLQLLTYIANLLTESEEFNKVIMDAKARELIIDDTKYRLTAEQSRKKPNLYRASGESLSYYASLVRFNFADIMVGAIDKLAIVAFLSSKCEWELSTRLSIIEELIKTVVNKNLGMDKALPLDNIMRSLEMKATDILKQRSEARIIMDSNDKNYPMVLQ